MYILLKILSMLHARLFTRMETATPPQQPKKKRLTSSELKYYLDKSAIINENENRHQHSLVSDMLYTDGVKFFAEEGGQEGAYLFLDLVASEIQPLLLQRQNDDAEELARMRHLLNPHNDDKGELVMQRYLLNRERKNASDIRNIKDAPVFYIELSVVDHCATSNGDGTLINTRLSSAMLHIFEEKEIYQKFYQYNRFSLEQGYWTKERILLNKVIIEYTDIQPGKWEFYFANNVLMSSVEFYVSESPF